MWLWGCGSVWKVFCFVQQCSSVELKIIKKVLDPNWLLSPWLKCLFPSLRLGLIMWCAIAVTQLTQLEETHRWAEIAAELTGHFGAAVAQVLTRPPRVEIEHRTLAVIKCHLTYSCFTFLRARETNLVAFLDLANFYYEACDLNDLENRGKWKQKARVPDIYIWH